MQCNGVKTFTRSHCDFYAPSILREIFGTLNFSPSEFQKNVSVDRESTKIIIQIYVSFGHIVLK